MFLLSSVVTSDLKIQYYQEKRNEIIILTYALTGIGLTVGIFSLLAGFMIASETTTTDPSADDLPRFDSFFRFIGISFISVALFSLIGCFLFSKGQKLGWVMLCIIYLGGVLVTGYVLLFSLVRFFPLALASPMLLIYIILLIIGLYVLCNLLIKVNYFYM